MFLSIGFCKRLWRFMVASRHSCRRFSYSVFANVWKLLTSLSKHLILFNMLFLCRKFECQWPLLPNRISSVATKPETKRESKLQNTEKWRFQYKKRSFFVKIRAAWCARTLQLLSETKFGSRNTFPAKKYTFRDEPTLLNAYSERKVRETSKTLKN